MMGTLIVMSALQGGPGFPVLLPEVYDYIVSGEYQPQDLKDSDVPDYRVQLLLAEVCVFSFIFVI